MALHYDLTEIEAYEDLSTKSEDGLYQVKSKWWGIIMATIYLGVGQLDSDKKLAEFYARNVLWCAVNGGVVRDDDKSPWRAYRMDEVARMRGLRTNASNITLAQFKKRLVDKALDDERRKMHEHMEASR